MAWRESSWVCQWSRAELRKHHKTTFSVPEAGSVRSRRALKGMCVRDRSGLLPKSLTRKTEAVIRKGLQTSRFAEADGKCPEILDMPPPHPPSNNAGNLATIFSRLRRNVSLRTPPTPPTVLLRQRLCFPDLPQIHHSPISFLQSGMESSMQGRQHPPHSAFTAILESAWQRPWCSSVPPFRQKEASTQDSLFNSLRQNPMCQMIFCFQPLTVIYFYLK